VAVQGECNDCRSKLEAADREATGCPLEVAAFTATRKGLTLEDLGLLMCDDISRWSDDERASLRAKMLRHYGLAKSADGKPS
jgi:hypothetical protein